jgi:hypothetical protein
MREIKFRAWGMTESADYQMYYPGSDGNYYKDGVCKIVTDSFGNFSAGLVFVCTWSEPSDGIGHGDPDPYVEQLFHHTLMQSTGVKDLMGNDIYEDDVVYLGGYGNYHVEFPFAELYEAAAERDIGDVLGNVHQHPELLEKK